MSTDPGMTVVTPLLVTKVPLAVSPLVNTASTVQVMSADARVANPERSNATANSFTIVFIAQLLVRRSNRRGVLNAKVTR
jgi:hypothetical protein